MTNCGISRWDDPNEINARLKALTSQPIWEVTDDYYNNVILKYFDEQCKGSKAVYEESKEYIPGGVQHNLAFNKPFPMCMAKANGAYLYDKDGNRYIDFLQAGGPTILGSNYPVIREKVIELLNECGPVTGLLHESELMIAREINRHMPNVEMFRMLGSGTESVMAAMRIARIATTRFVNRLTSSFSCVTTMTVVPRALICSSSIMISSERAGSRLPVGSSAMMTLGLLTSARAMATRCCSPPDSSFGSRRPLFSSPTSSST